MSAIRRVMQVGVLAATLSVTGATVAAAANASTTFTGRGSAATKEVAYAAAKSDAWRQATAAGFQHCVLADSWVLYFPSPGSTTNWHGTYIIEC